MQDQDRSDNSYISKKFENKDENRILDNKITQSFLFLILLFCVLLPYLYRSSEDVEVPRESIDYIKVKFRESGEYKQESVINTDLDFNDESKSENFEAEVDIQHQYENFHNKEENEIKEEQEKHAETDDISEKTFQNNSEINPEVINTAEKQIGNYSRDPGFKATDKSVEEYNRSLDVKFLKNSYFKKI